MPSAAANWFDPDSISELEMSSLPEFFTGHYPSKTPATYREYRDFMITLYRMQSAVYLTATTCRRHLSGDVCAIMRVHQFLETHGLINFTVAPESKPLNKQIAKESTYDRVLINAANKHVLERSENEYLNTMIDVTPTAGETREQTTEINPQLVDPASLRKINILTSKERPICTICGTKCGFSWHQADASIACNMCFQAGQVI